MKVIQVELPDAMAAEIDALMLSGWFDDETEIVRLALAEFIQHNRMDLQEQFKLDEMAWSLQQRRPNLLQ